VAYAWITLPDVRPLATTPPASTAFMDMRAAEARAASKPARKSQRWIPYGRGTTLTGVLSPATSEGTIRRDQPPSGSIETGEPMRGASTITQQLAKNLYLSPSRNPMRKLTELFITRRLEVALTKRRILELYLNVIEWGDGIWGCEAAARAYFGVSASDLSASQAALMAGAIINPRRYSPAHPNGRLLRRQAIILRRMGDVTPPGVSEDAPRADKPGAPIG
jgi:monofunctional biosynthetic peptidoglycan transglycosylase